MASSFLADGSHWRYLHVPTADEAEGAGRSVRFGADGRAIRKLVPELLGRVVGDVSARLALSPAEFDRFFAHQPNAAWMPHLLTALQLDPARLDLFVDRTGTIPSVMIPLGLDRAFRSERPPRAGERLLLFSVGAGVAAGAVAWEVG